MEKITPASERIIGHYRGADAGALVVAIGGIHGNEPAGVLALNRLFDLLTEEPLLNPGFSFRGELLALRGNLAALREGTRFIEEDLNRIWRVREPGQQNFRSSEDQELYEIITAIETALEENPLSELVLLDLHTTSEGGGIFAITGDDTPSLSLAAEMYVPVIKGLLSGMQGTTLHYFRSGHFLTDFPVRAITFDAGQHDDPKAVDLALAATVNLLRALGCLRDEDVSTWHDDILREAARHLPRITELQYVHRIAADGSDRFVMQPGFRNFSPVTKGMRLATDKNGDVLAPANGFLLMPNYREEGEEGFFLLKSYVPSAAY